MDYPYRQHYSSAVLRRGQPFFMAVRMKDRSFDPRRDIMRVVFTFGMRTSNYLLNLNEQSNRGQARTRKLPRVRRLFCPSA